MKKKYIIGIIDFVIQSLIAIAITVASIIGLCYGLIAEDGTILLLTYCGFLISFIFAGMSGPQLEDLIELKERAKHE